jgi:hypothetical protein
MAVSSFAVFANETSVSLSPEQIERELSSMWKPINEAHGASVSRVVLGNVLWLGCSARLEHVRSVFQRVITRYPARIFLLEYQPANTSDEMVAAVNAQCFRPNPGEPPICCEVIHLAFGPAAARHLRGAVAPLLVPDVQTVLWRNLADTPFPELAALQRHVDRTVCMVSLTNDPVKHLKEAVGRSHPTLDLSWFRTTPLREQVTAFFDDVNLGFDLLRVSTIEVGGSAGEFLPKVVAATFLGWMGARLAWCCDGTTGATGLRLGSPDSEICLAPWKDGDDRFIRLRDQHGAIFEIHLAEEGMILRVESPGRPVTEQHLRTHQLREDEALGLALNTPSKARHFREAAVLAVPILEFLHANNR